MRAPSGLLLTVVLLAVGMPTRVAAQKTDTLTLINGDRITGEIKSVARGKLEYATDDAGTLSIEWIKVVRLTSVRSFDITDRFGKRHFGQLRRSPADRLLAIGNNPADTLRIEDAVELTELGGRLTQRLTGAADAGFTYTKANKARTLSLNGDLVYRGPKFGASIALDSYEQDQQDLASVSRRSGTLTATRFLQDRWSIESVLTIEKNDELNLARRTFGGGGVGRALRESNHDNVKVIAGAVVTDERFTVDGAADLTNTNLEAVASLKAESFRFDKPKLRLVSSLNVFKSFSTSGRVRGDASFETKYEGNRDLTVGLRVKDTFDSKPPTTDASKNDYTVTFTLGWSYRR